MKFKIFNKKLYKGIIMKKLFFIFFILTATQLAQAEQNNCNSLNK